MANSGPNGEWSCGPRDWSEFLPVVGWSVHYVDGSCVTCEEGSWEAAPDEGVAAVVVEHHEPSDKPRRTIIQGHDEYAMIGHTATKRGKQVGRLNGPKWRGIEAAYRARCQTIAPRFDG